MKDRRVTDRDIMLQIESDWSENEKNMGEYAALECACEMNFKTSEWFYDHIHLITKNITNERK